MTTLLQPELGSHFSRILSDHPSDGEQLLIRYALIWLCVSRKPLRAHELWIALQVQEAQSLEQVERYVAEDIYVDETKAVQNLQMLLGPLILFTEAKCDRNGCLGFYVQFAEPQFKDLILYDPDIVPEVFTFDGRQAHMVVTSVCIVIVSVTCMHLSRIHDTSTASGLVLYAWTHWARHLRLSHNTLNAPNIGSMLNGAVSRVCSDTIVVSLKIKDILTSPFPCGPGKERLEGVIKVKRAQQALEKVLRLVAALSSLRSVDVLQRAKACVDQGLWAEQGEVVSAGEPTLAVILDTTSMRSSKLLSLTLDPSLFRHKNTLGKTEQNFVRAFADTARCLRELAGTLVDAQSLIEEEMSLHFDSSSLLDVLFHTAGFFESFASYPFWNMLSDHDSTECFKIDDINDEFYDAVRLILAKVRLDEFDKGAGFKLSSRDWSSKPSFSLISATTSSYQWQTAVWMEKMRSFQRRPGKLLTINDIAPLSRRTNSFPMVASAIRPDPESHADILFALLPESLKRFARRRVAPVLSRLYNSPFLKSIDDFASGAFTAGAPQLWQGAKTAIFLNGPGSAIGIFCTAFSLVLLRRFITPWLGSHVIYGQPITDIRLAFTDPIALLARTLGPSWVWIMFMLVQKWLFDVGGIMALAFIATAEGRLPENVLEPIRAHPHIVVWFERGLATCKVLYLAWALCVAEFIFSRVVEGIVVPIAYWRLLFSGDQDHVLLGRLLQARWDKLPLHWYMILYYVKSALWPSIYVSIGAAITGQPGMLVFVTLGLPVVAALVSWPEQCEVALRYGSMTLCLMATSVTAILLVIEFLQDPLMLKPTTRRLSQEATLARHSVPGNGMARTWILRRKGACPLELDVDAAPSAEAEAVSWSSGDLDQTGQPVESEVKKQD